MDRSSTPSWKLRYLPSAVSLLVLLSLGLALALVAVSAQEPPPEQVDVPPNSGAVQEFVGHHKTGTAAFFLILDLREGQVLYANMAHTSGNLDPLLLLFSEDVDAESVRERFWNEILDATEAGQDPLEAMPTILDDLSLAWNDDSGPGYDAALEYTVPADGNYLLMTTSSPLSEGFGDYRLLIGIDAPDVFSGEAEPTGHTIAVLDEDVSVREISVEQSAGTITLEKPENRLRLTPMRAGDTFYAYVEATEGNLTPVLVLNDFGEKPVRSSNFSGADSKATLEYTLDHDAEGYELRLFGHSGAGTATTGKYRLLVGINEPEVLTGESQPVGGSILVKPIKVEVGVELQQITGVDQVSENFGAVARFLMEWHDPKLAFSPDTCDCKEKVFTGDGFAKFAEANEIDWPQFTILNQQGNRWVQNRNVVVDPDGSALYFERFTTDFQAPLFDFTKFPFDTQELYVQLGSLYEEETFFFSNPEELGGIGDQLGEEEWYIVDSEHEVTSQDSRSVYELTFFVHRYLTFYIFRIIVPIIVIILVSWFTFFLKDYGKRVDVSGANLLVFVAFNFTISGDLPRLGYLTFMDVILIGTFIISAFVIAWNVALKRLELRGRRDLAERIDAYSIWIYPLLYVIGGFLAYWLFLK